MASGDTNTGSLADSLPVIRHSARLRADFPFRMPMLCEPVRLDENTGLDWTEITVEKLTAQAVTESTILDNPQQLQDALFSVTPTMSGIQTFITDRTMRRISKNVAALLGRGAQAAIERLKDTQGLAVLATGTSIAGAGSTLTSGHISAAVSRARYNGGSEPLMTPISFVGHSFQIKDIQDEVVSGVGTYTVPTGITEQFFRNGFSGSLFGANVFIDDNIVIDAASDAKGGVFPREAIVLVSGAGRRAVTVRNEKKGGGGDDLYVYDEYAYGVRHSGALFMIYSDATAPTS